MKRILSVFLCTVLIAVCLSACGGEKPELISNDDVQVVTVTVSPYSSYMYVIEDQGAVEELVELYNSLRYENKPLSDEVMSAHLYDTMYMLNYYSTVENGDFSGSIASCWISPERYVLFDDAVSHGLLSDFDEEHLKQLLEEYNTFR